MFPFLKNNSCRTLLSNSSRHFCERRTEGPDPLERTAASFNSGIVGLTSPASVGAQKSPVANRPYSSRGRSFSPLPANGQPHQTATLVLWCSCACPLIRCVCNCTASLGGHRAQLDGSYWRNLVEPEVPQGKPFVLHAQRCLQTHLGMCKFHIWQDNRSKY